MSMFLKRLPGGTSRKDFGVDSAFHNEGVMYQQILPLLGKSEQFARSYHAQNDLIVLQDLRRDGYKMADRKTGFDLKTAKIIMKDLSRFHAASFKEIISNNNEFVKSSKLLEPIGLAVSSSKDMVESCLERIIKLVQDNPDLTDSLRVLRKLQGRVTEHLKALKKADVISVLCHGDFWLNNIMIDPEYPDRVRIVDLQACGIHSPAVDVWTFLYSSLESTFDTSSLDSLISGYCENFLDNLTALDLPPNSLPTIASLKEELLSKELYGLLVATVYLPARYIRSEEILKYDENSMKENDEFHNQLFESDMKGAICNILRLCEQRGLFEKVLV